MKDEHLIELGSIKARLDNVEKKLDEVPTRPELEVFTETLKNLVEIQKTQAGHIQAFSDYVNKWRGAAIVLIAIGAVLAKIFDLVTYFWTNHNS